MFRKATFAAMQDWAIAAGFAPQPEIESEDIAWPPNIERGRRWWQRLLSR